MKVRCKDYTGKNVGYLTVMENTYKKDKKGSYIWKMKCDCGDDYYGVPADLPKNAACGCRHKKHGMYNTRIYRIWSGMISRCGNPKLKDYKDYGGRGIEVYKDWQLDFRNFYAWAIKTGYKEDLTIERINVNGNYEPDNCIWIQSKFQQDNRTDTVYFKAISPSGEIHISKNYARFGRKYNLNRGNIGKVLSGEYSQYKGWKFFRLSEEEFNEQRA